jgi:S1/P1 Nuclease
VQTRDRDPVNILTAMTENESMAKKESDAERRAIAIAWLFHLVGDIHQPLHTAQLFTTEYPQGRQGQVMRALCNCHAEGRGKDLTGKRVERAGSVAGDAGHVAGGNVTPVLPVGFA